MTLLPIIIGLVLWNRLPDQMPTHFTFSGEADEYSRRAYAVFFFPLLMFGIHILCAFLMTLDPKNENISWKIYSMVLWICPTVSIIVAVMMYAPSLGYEVNVSFLMMLFIAVLTIVIGNYLPKCRHNYTVGIRLPWTMADEDNWNRTHRMAGPLWIVGGFVMLANVFIRFKTEAVFVAVLIIAALVPTVYSFLLYRRKRKT